MMSLCKTIHIIAAASADAANCWQAKIRELFSLSELYVKKIGIVVLFRMLPDWPPLARPSDMAEIAQPWGPMIPLILE